MITQKQIDERNDYIKELEAIVESKKNDNK